MPNNVTPAIARLWLMALSSDWLFFPTTTYYQTIPVLFGGGKFSDTALDFLDRAGQNR